jgi:ATP-binding protein involved in chromosome partitioning
MSRKVRTYHELDGADRSGLGAQVGAQRERVRARLTSVARVIAVMSGKGGVGKSFVTATLATTLARRRLAVGVLDADLHGPTTARMLGATGPLEVTADGVRPATATEGVRVMSSDLLLPEDAPLAWREPAGDGFVWRGTLEAGMLREFLGDVAWGDLDVLLVDLPPGTERLSALIEFVPDLSGILAVTIPSDSSRRAVARALEMAKQRGARILGVIENMAGYECPSCGKVAPLFQGEAAKTLAKASGAPVLASIPFDPAAQAGADGGRLRTDGAAAHAIAHVADALMTEPART